MTHVLFACASHHHYSIAAATLLNHYGTASFEASNASLLPPQKANKYCLAALKKHHIPLTHKKTMPWPKEVSDILIVLGEEITHHDLPATDTKIQIHWPMPDPARYDPSKKELAAGYMHMVDILERRIQMLIHLPLAELRPEVIHEKLTLIGNI